MATTIQDTVDLGALIRRTRRSQALTQKELAGACGTSVRFIVELEKGKPTCHVGKVLHVLSMLGLELSLGDRSEDGRR